MRRFAKGNTNTFHQMVWNVADAELSTLAAACFKRHGSNTVDAINVAATMKFRFGAGEHPFARRKGSTSSTGSRRKLRFRRATNQSRSRDVQSHRKGGGSSSRRGEAISKLGAAAARSIILDSEISALQSERPRLFDKKLLWSP